MKSIILSLFLFLTIIHMKAQTNQQDLPYFEIPEYPKNYNPGSLAARMIDGLGFRYYWATEGLRDVDLAFKPSSEARTTEETIDHILNLSNVIVNATLKKANGKNDFSKLSYIEKRNLTLNNFKTAADILRISEDISQFKIIFIKNEKTTIYPFWNQINGPIEDAVWHCGQIVSFRRSSGNPYNSKASVFTGKVRE